MELQSRNRGMSNVIKIEFEIQESNGHTKYQENCDSSTTSPCGAIMISGLCCIKRKTWIKAKKGVIDVNCGHITHPVGKDKALTKNA